MGVINPTKPRPTKIVLEDNSFFFISADDELVVGTKIFDNIGEDSGTAIWANTSIGDFTLEDEVTVITIGFSTEDGKTEITTLS